jgi:hypothetical protein
MSFVVERQSIFIKFMYEGFVSLMWLFVISSKYAFLPLYK